MRTIRRGFRPVPIRPGPPSRQSICPSSLVPPSAPKCVGSDSAFEECPGLPAKGSRGPLTERGHYRYLEYVGSGRDVLERNISVSRHSRTRSPFRERNRERVGQHRGDAMRNRLPDASANPETRRLTAAPVATLERLMNPDRFTRVCAFRGRSLARLRIRPGHRRLRRRGCRDGRGPVAEAVHEVVVAGTRSGAAATCGGVMVIGSSFWRCGDVRRLRSVPPRGPEPRG